MKRIIFLLFLLINLLQYSAQSQNIVSTYSGNGSTGFNNGQAGSATFSSPFGLCIDKNHNLYIADGGNNCIRKINTLTGVVSTFAGTGVAGYLDGPADSAKFNSPSDLCADDSGNVYVCDFLNQRIRKISSAGLVSTVAGSGTAGYADGLTTSAKFNYPRGICIDPSGNLYIGDSWNHRIRKIDMGGMVTTYAGGGTSMGVSSVGLLVDGADTSARFYTPAGLAIGASGIIYVADAYNHRIRAIDALRMVTTIAGSGSSGPGNGGYLNGNAASSVFNTPTELFADTNNDELYISDTFNNRIRKLDFNSNVVINYAGNGTAAYTDSVDTLASFNYPRGIVAVDSVVYVVDYNNHSIRVIHPDNSSGIYDLEFYDLISVFPNPSEDVVSISGVNSLMKISMYDMNGKCVGEFPGGGMYKVQIDISRFPAGVYVARVQTTNQKSISKLLVHY